MFFILVLVAGIYLFTKLPSKSQIQSFLQTALPQDQPGPEKIVKGSVSQKTHEPINSPETAAPKPDAKTAEDKKADKLLRKMLSQDISQIQVCEHLGAAAKYETKEKIDELMNQAIDDADNENPLTTSLKIPIQIALERPTIRSLMQEAMEMPKGQDESVLQKMGFYKRALDAYKDLRENRQDLERLSDRAYHLYVIGRAVQKRPELANDPRTRDFCGQVQQLLLSQTIPQNLDEERAEVLKFLDYVKLTPQEIGFDPQAWTKLNFDLDFKKRTFQFGAGQNRR
jgi:hypothetical protein